MESKSTRKTPSRGFSPADSFDSRAFRDHLLDAVEKARLLEDSPDLDLALRILRAGVGALEYIASQIDMRVCTQTRISHRTGTDASTGGDLVFKIILARPADEITTESFLGDYAGMFRIPARGWPVTVCMDGNLTEAATPEALQETLQCWITGQEIKQYLFRKRYSVIETVPRAL